MYIFSNSLSVSASQPCAFGNCSFPLLTFHDMESSSSGCQINFFFISETEYQLSINSSYKRGQRCSISINLERKSRLIRWIPEVLVWKVSPEVQQRQLWNWSEGCRWSLWHFSSRLTTFHQTFSPLFWIKINWSVDGKHMVACEPDHDFIMFKLDK